MKKLALVVGYFLFTTALIAQNGFVFNCTKDTVLNCSQTCITLKAFIPDIHSGSNDYNVNSISGAGCFTPPVRPDLPGTPTNLNQDDTYTDIINLPFDFPFYGIIYAGLVASTNGLVSFDLSKANASSHYGILTTGTGLTASGSTATPVDLPSTKYDRALIMGVYMDINPFYTTSPTQRIKYEVIGNAPHRKWILSFYKVPTYNTACQNLINNTYQIVLYEGTGIIDIFVYGREICTSWNQGRGMIGLQNYDRDKGIMPTGRAASSPLWGNPNMNEAWRFIPKTGPSSYKKVQLFDLAGTLIATGDTTSAGNGLFQVNFPNICPTANTTYIVKSTYTKFDDPNVEIYGADTVRVTLSGTPPIIAENVTPAPCGTATTGTITITSPVGANYQYSIDGGSTFQVSPVFVKAPGTYSIIVKNISSGCSVTKDITISSLSTLSATATPTNASCIQAANGSILVTASLGTPGYSYKLDNNSFQPSNIFSGLTPNDYTITVKDNAGCLFILSTSVEANSGFTTTATSTNASCRGISNGSINVVVPTSGIAPYSYSIPGLVVPQSSPLITSIASGSYTIKVTDAVGCSFSFGSIVGNDPGVSATDSIKLAACATANTGKIFIKPTSGIAPFSFSKDSGVIYQVADSFINLLPGLYYMRVKDAVGCYFDINSTIGIGPGVSATDSTVKSACSTATTGKIFIRPGIGIAPFSFSKDSGVIYQVADSFINLLPGLYYMRVKDAVGCYFDLNSTIGIGPGVSATDSTVKSACSTATTGKIFIRPGIGIAPFSFSKDAGLTFQTADSFINLLPGTYQLRVKDAVGCTYNFSSTVGFNPGINSNFVKINSACLGVSTGKIVVQPTAGITPFSYSLNAGLNYQLLDTFKNLASGNYTIQIRDAVGCIYISPSQQVNNDPGITANYSLVKAACAGSATGAIIVKPITGSYPFKYSLDAGLTFQYDSVLRNLASNAYSIRITDTMGCILNSPVQNISNNPGVLTNPSTINNASCATIPNGAITVNVTAGIAPFTFTLSSVPPSNPQASNIFSGLFSASYTINIKDSAGCATSISPVIGNNPKVKFDSLTVIRPTCFGLLNGTASIHSSLGVTPYTYALDSRAYQSNKLFNGIGAGSHTLYVTDANGCIIDTTITVSEPLILTDSIVSTKKSTCTGNPDGQIVVAATGGTLPYQYTIDQNGLAGYQSAAIFPVISGTYKVTVQDAKACKAIVNIVVDSVFSMFLDLGPDTTICVGQSIVLKTITNAETSIFKYSPSKSLNDSTLKNPTATAPDTTKYRLVATWGICQLKDSIIVNVLHKPIANAGKDTAVCYLTTALLHGTASNLSGPVKFLWSPGSKLAKADSAITLASPDSTQIYLLTVTDNYGCNFSVTDEMVVTMQPPVPAYAGKDSNAVIGIPHQLFGTGAGPGGSYNWTWSSPLTGVAINNTMLANPKVTIQTLPPLQNGYPDNYYDFYLKATDFATCVGRDTVRIHIFKGPTYYCPNAFSPNNDGTNDIFRAIPVGVETTEYFRIYNRYGQMIFETNRFMQGWDGRYMGQLQPTGAYVWMIKGKDRNGKIVELKGTVMLIR